MNRKTAKLIKKCTYTVFSDNVIRRKTLYNSIKNVYSEMSHKEKAKIKNHFREKISE